MHGSCVGKVQQVFLNTMLRRSESISFSCLLQSNTPLRKRFAWGGGRGGDGEAITRGSDCVSVLERNECST